MAIYNRDPSTGELTSLTGESNISNLTSAEKKELTNTATKSHTKGDYFNLNGTFVKAINNISIGDTLTEGTNIETTNVGTELSEIESDLGSKSSASAVSGDTAFAKINSLNGTISNTNDEYSSSSAYKVGDLVIYNNILYRCTTACSAASWTVNQSNFTQTTIANAVDTLNAALTAHEFGTGVDISGYTGTNYYLVPTDGYGYIINTTGESRLYAVNTDKTTGVAIGANKTIASLYVKKGMYLTLNTLSGALTLARFYPLE